MVFRLALNLRIEVSRIVSLSKIITFLYGVKIFYFISIHRLANSTLPFPIHTHVSPNLTPPARVSINE
jgi:hypothetical protein